MSAAVSAPVLESNAVAVSGPSHASRSTPPSARDWLAYRMVKVEQLSTRRAAEQLGISQTRVCQVVDRVLQFIAEMASVEVSPEERNQQLRVAESLAAHRLDFLYEEAMSTFRESKGPQTVTRHSQTAGQPEKRSTTMKHSIGEGRMLLVAAKLAQMKAKMRTPVALPQLPDEMEALPPLEASKSHLVEDCSHMFADQPVTAKTEKPASTATTPAKQAYAREMLSSIGRNVDSLRPVQPTKPQPSAAREKLLKQPAS